ncbi:MAG: DRTGG domain-containing protein [Salinivirgaceae bacterium]|jgi:serine kinase of HPr protein (carbohydrate metabolism regulator)|nr:DRTGG domain-containing protein [Salinivirgaceae bacterium]
MQVQQIVKKLNLTVIGGNDGIDNEITGGYTSDLLSDVMGNVGDGNVWITLQTHKNVMAIASLRDISAVILVKGLKPDADMLEKANEEGIPVLGTEMETFEVTGKLFGFLQK